MTLQLSSPAKINLTLRVLGKRPDGFHELETLFERIDLCDTMSFGLRLDGQIVITCANPAVPTDSRNLVYKAAAVLRNKTGCMAGANIRITKRIPVAAGLAGGSSNGATALVGLNRLWKLGLSRRQLVAAGRQIGSDVPFFLYDTPFAIGRGRGDVVRPLSLPSKLWHLLVVPNVSMYTPEVYGGFKIELTKPNRDVNILVRLLRKDRISDAGRCVFNDLEHSITSINPKLLTLKHQLEKLNSKGVAFSGSGPSVFALAESQKEAKRLHDLLDKRYNRVFVVKTL